MNAYLTDLQMMVYEAQGQLTLGGNLINAEAIRDKFQGKEEKQTTLIGVFTEHNRKMEVLLGTEYIKGTAQRYHFP